MTSEALFLIISLTIVTFFASNLDNFMLLIGYMGNYSSYKREVIIGYLIAIFIVTLTALFFSYFTEFFPANFIKFLGVIPISLGIYQIFQMFKPSSANHSLYQLDSSYSRVKICLIVCGIMLANSGDKLAIFSAFMADTQDELRWIVIFVSLIMALLWGIIAKIFLSVNYLHKIILPVSKYVLPFILIIIGLYILIDSPTDE